MNRHSIRTFARLVYPAALLLFAGNALADPVCPLFSPILAPPQNPLPPGALPRITADRAQIGEEGISTLSGSVRLEDPTRAAEASNMFYHRSSNWVETTGPLRYQDQNLGIEASSGEMNIKSGEGHFNDSRFTLSQVRAHGKAKQLSTNGKGVTDMKGVEYTSCDNDDKDWVLNASSIHIDEENTTGEARNAVLRFKGVPVLYAPYFSFPVGVDRKSGFLAPIVGGSKTGGFQLAAPYYFNIAPNMDDTLTPRVLTKRGAQLSNEFRYLTNNSQGEVGIDYLPDDRKSDRDRYLGSYKHNALLTDNWNLGIDYTRVSDKSYFVDLSDNLGSSSRTHLEQALRVGYQNPSGWLTFHGLAQGFQPLDSNIVSANQAPARLPQLRLDMLSPRIWHIQPSLETEFVRFTRGTGEEGNRLDLHPTLGLGVDRNSWFANARAGYHYTDYDLNNRSPGLDERPSRSLPTYSFDTGLRFERLAFGGNRIQTLEPRLYYLYTPFRNQNDLPLFDTTVPDFDIDELFTENRFTGIDRIGDANQLTTAVSSKLINPANGNVGIRGTIGEIYYFDDPRVAVPGFPAATNPDHSDFLAATDFRFSEQWSAGLSGQWATEDKRFNRGSARLQYRADSGSVFNAAYRFRRDLLEQTDLSFIVPISTRWKFVSRWNYSLLDDANVETLAGFEYSSCCYAIQTAFRRYVSRVPGEYNNSIFLQLELMGLGKIGSGIDEMLNRDVRNYISN